MRPLLPVAKGDWQREGHVLYSDRRGNEIRFCFDGTGIAVCGWWVKNGGKADVYVDGTSRRTQRNHNCLILSSQVFVFMKLPSFCRVIKSLPV